MRLTKHSTILIVPNASESDNQRSLLFELRLTVFDRFEVPLRTVRFAFDYAVNRHYDQAWRGLSQQDIDAGYRAQVTLCGKTNVFTKEKLKNQSQDLNQ